MANIDYYYVEDGYVEEGYSANYKSTKVSHLDFKTKRIHINSGVSEYHPVDDLYTEIRFIRRKDISLRLMDMPVEARGNIAKGGGKFTSRLAIFKHGWRIVPANESHVLKVTGEQITDEGTSGVAVMDMTLFDTGVNVSIEYAPPDTEIIQIDIPTNVVTGDISDVPTALENASAVWSDSAATSLQSDITFLKDIEGGRWIMDELTNQMIFYAEDNTTEVARFNLKDKDGNANYQNVFERVRV